MVKLMASV